LVGLTWAGITYPWNSVQVIGALSIGAVFLAGFGVWETMPTNPS